MLRHASRDLQFSMYFEYARPPIMNLRVRCTKSEITPRLPGEFIASELNSQIHPAGIQKFRHSLIAIRRAVQQQFNHLSGSPR